MRKIVLLIAAITSFIASGADIATGHYVLAPMWAACGGIWLYLWSRKR